MSNDLYRLTATEALKGFEDGGLKVFDYAMSLLDHIDQRQPAVQAFEYIDRSQVLQQAQALDHVPKDKRGPLHGVAVAVKDVIYTKGSLAIRSTS